MSPRGRGQDQEAGHQVPAWLQCPERSDLQFIARGHRGAGRGQGRPPDHRDQRAERGGRAAREDRQPARHLSRGDPHEDHAHLHVSSADWPGDPSLHLKCRTQFPQNDNHKMLLPKNCCKCYAMQT